MNDNNPFDGSIPNQTTQPKIANPPAPTIIEPLSSAAGQTPLMNLPEEPPPSPIVNPVPPRPKLTPKRIITVAVVFLVMASIPAAIFLATQRQETRKEATTPEGTGASPSELKTKEKVINLEKAASAPIMPGQEGPFACPSISQFCQKGADILFDNNYYGFGSDLPSGSSLFAAFDGKLTTTLSSIPKGNQSAEMQKINLVMLTNKDLLLRAAYLFPGPVPQEQTVKKGDKIGTVSGENMPLYGKVSLVFILTRNDQVMGSRLGGERVKLTKADFKIP